MIVTYEADGVTTTLTQAEENEYQGSTLAPDLAGVYTATVTAEGVTYISRYQTELYVNQTTPRVTDLKQYVPEFVANLKQMKELYGIQEYELDAVKYYSELAVNNFYLDTADNQTIERIEKFLGVQAKGSLQNRIDYLKNLYQNGTKLNRTRIDEIVQNITGGECIITFYAANERENPKQGYGYLEVKVKSPDVSKDYNFDNIIRTLQAIVPAHIKVKVQKWFCTWQDISVDYGSWGAIRDYAANWDTVYQRLPVVIN